MNNEVSGTTGKATTTSNSNHNSTSIMSKSQLTMQMPMEAARHNSSSTKTDSSAFNVRFEDQQNMIVGKVQGMDKRIGNVEIN